MSKIEAKKIAKKYAEVLKENDFSFEAVYLFGSFAQGKNTKWSDIDLAVVSKRFENDFLNNELLLSRLSLRVDSRIESHGFTKDDFKLNCNPFAWEIEKTGIRVA